MELLTNFILRAYDGTKLTNGVTYDAESGNSCNRDRHSYSLDDGWNYGFPNYGWTSYQQAKKCFTPESSTQAFLLVDLTKLPFDEYVEDKEVIIGEEYADPFWNSSMKTRMFSPLPEVTTPNIKVYYSCLVLIILRRVMLVILLPFSQI